MKISRPDEINTLLERQVEAYAEFLSATLLLKKTLGTDEMTVVNHMIERREALIGIIDGIDREIMLCQDAGPHSQSPATLRRAAMISTNLGEILRKIISVNQDCTAIAVNELEVLRQDLMIIRRQEEGLHGYASRTERVSKFLSVQT